jgi:hypothetical protein
MTDQPVNLDATFDHLNEAKQLLPIWHDKLPDDEDRPDYYTAGEDALKRMDQAMLTLGQLRWQLAHDLKADDAERDARVAETIAPYRDLDDEGQPEKGRAHVDQPDPAANERAHW